MDVNDPRFRPIDYAQTLDWLSALEGIEVFAAAYVNIPGQPAADSGVGARGAVRAVRMVDAGEPAARGAAFFQLGDYVIGSGVNLTPTGFVHSQPLPPDFRSLKITFKPDPAADVLFCIQVTPAV